MSHFAGSEVARTGSRKGVAGRMGSAEEQAEASRAHATAVLAAYIEKTVAAAPPLEPAQLDRLALLLRGESL